MRRFLAFWLILGCSVSFAQQEHIPPVLRIKKATGAIHVDGVLDENDWNLAQAAKNFDQHYPADTCKATTKTEVRITYNEGFIYIGAVCFDEIEADYIVQSLKRDFDYNVSDAFVVFIDPLNDKTNGFSFAVNPLGVQRESLISLGGGMFGESSTWDNKWLSKVSIHADKWVVEMAIPFKTLRFKEGISQWGVNFIRIDMKRNENSSWALIPQNFDINSIAFNGTMIWDEPPRKAGGNVSLIPYGISSAYHNYKDTLSADLSVNAGLDAKVAVTSSLNLDLTFNPDFSQVEVDAQQTNLTRFNLFFPEKRQFFVENSDLFGAFGFRQIRPFFSRTIGLYNGLPVQILGGARLSGKLNQNWRTGLMNMQTNSDTMLGVNSQNYSVAILQRQVFARSNISGILVNRQGFTNKDLNPSDYNRVAGLDFNLASADNKWNGKIFYHQSFSPGSSSRTNSSAAYLLYSTRRVFAMWNHEYVGENYRADAGFVPRNSQFNPEIGQYIKVSYWRLEPSIEYKFYPKSGPVYNHGPGLYVNNYYDGNFKPTDWFYMPNYKVNFRNTSLFQVHYHEYFTKLNYDFDVTYSGAAPLPAGNYYYRNVLLKYRSDQSKKLGFDVKANYGSFYNGTKLTVVGAANFRTQPWGIFSISFEQNQIALPDSFGDAAISLIGPKIELSFTKSLFFTAFIQYNTQADNANINTRFQWRFKPMSDLYIVYTDNYDQNLGVKNRAVVVKLIYWLSL